MKIAPGVTIKDELEFAGISMEEFSDKMLLSLEECNDLLNGEMVITLSVALKLERVLEIPARVWINLELEYRQPYVLKYYNEK
ncbi:MAG: helix-turn-helix transcriptional regulator [Fusobacteriaceae bacterium]